MNSNIFKVEINKDKWHYNESEKFQIYSTGSFHYKNKYYVDHNIGTLLTSILNEDFSPHNFNHLEYFNGSWSIIIYLKKIKKMMIVVDRYRSIPLFYTNFNGKIEISDDFNKLSKKTNNQIDEVSELQFYLSGFVTGENTLLKNIFQLKPSSYIYFEDTINKIEKEYTEFFSKNLASDSLKKLESDLEKIIYNIRNRLRTVCTNKKVFLPLSGGNDSRLIAWMLKTSGIENVICYTYGVSDNPQKKIAKSIAEAMGFDWYFIEYSKEEWNKILVQNKDRENFWLYSSNGVSLPHLQDYPAVNYLFSKGLINKNSVFLPGHIGDAWANEFAVKKMNSYYPLPPQEYHSKYLKIFNSKSISFIIHRHLMFFPVSKFFWKQPKFKKLISRLKSQMNNYNSDRKGEIWRALEWILKSRTCLWITNSVRTFEYYGANFYLPLADSELIDFLKKLPLEHIIDRKLYSRVIRRILVSDQSSFGKELSKIEFHSGGIRDYSFKRRIIRSLKFLNVYNFIEKFRHQFRKETNLNFEHWFTMGRRSEKIKVIDILKKQDTLKFIDQNFLKIIEKYFKKPSYSIHCNAIFSLIFISSFKKKYGK